MLGYDLERRSLSCAKSIGLFPVYKMIDTCASELESYVPYFYSTYERENETRDDGKTKIVVLGSGPIRIGQGVEFDYSPGARNQDHTRLRL